MRQNPRPNEIYKHFKGNLYQIISIAKHSETMEDMVVYQQLYAPYGVYVRPLEMFVSEVDHAKYPEVTQKYRFEKIQEPAWEHAVEEKREMPVATKTPEAETKVAPQIIEETTQDEEEEITLDPGLLEFLEADSYEEKLEILNRIHNTLTDSIIDTMAVSLDIEVQEGDIEKRYAELMACLLKMEHFECNRLR